MGSVNELDECLTVQRGRTNLNSPTLFATHKTVLTCLLPVCFC